MKSLLRLAGTVMGLLVCVCAHATWNGDWASRQKIMINTSDDGAGIKNPVDQATILVRLHTGNFAFADAKPDGSDLRFIADDDKTPLKFHIEQYDGLTEVALIWVTVPKIQPANKTQFIWLYYNNPKAPPASDPKTTYDAAQAVVLHFAEKDGLPKDATAYGNNASESTATVDPAGLIGNGLTFNGTQHVTIAASPSTRIGANGVTASMWIKPVASAANAVLFRVQEDKNTLSLTLAGDKLVAAVNGTATPAAGSVPVGSWHHVAVVVHDHLQVLLDGNVVADVPVSLPSLGGPIELGNGYNGEMDEFNFATTARSIDGIRLEALGQGSDQKLVTYGQAEGGADQGGTSYFSILLGSVTVDGWVVIGILMFMMVVSFSVMIMKGLLVAKTGRADTQFKKAFDQLAADLVAIDQAGGHAARFRDSAMYRIYHVGASELKKRFAHYQEKGQPATLSPQSIDAIRASLDAGLTRETQRLNSKMVLLTIAISGGPFLGLLGTVVGVMITFAAIAAAGDVNVNSIAPGIAAALVATVAGLGVAIPSLFGYNYLASRIKDLTTDLHVFVDEFVSRVAESYSA